MAGYSGTPLASKLGLKPGFRVRTTHAPEHYAELVAPLPQGVQVSARLTGGVDVWHAFTSSERELRALLPRMLRAVRPAGSIWISWPKQASKLPTDVTEDVIRKLALPLGLVDVKVCAVDDTWSGLKLVLRKERRG